MHSNHYIPGKGIRLLAIGVLLTVIVSCGKKNTDPQEGKTLFTRMDSNSTGIEFINNLNFTDSVNIFYDQYMFNGGGVSAGDINNDGLCDLFFTSNQNGCKLYLNKGGFKFEDITAKAGITAKGWCTGTAMADVNNDGFLDIHVCRSGNMLPEHLGPRMNELRNLLYINQGNGTFREMGQESGITESDYSSQATFFDADNDGDLDFFLANHPFNWAINIDKPWSRDQNSDPYNRHKLYINNGKGQFAETGDKAGVRAFAFGLACTAGDINNDGFQDLYVSNDYEYPDFLYYSNGNGTFTDRRPELLQHTSLFSMGNDVNDIDNNGWADVFTCDMLPADNHRRKTNVGPDSYDKYRRKIMNNFGEQFMRNNLQMNEGGTSFSDRACFAGVEATDWSWAPLIADFDRDGKKDIYITNGYYKDFNDLDFMIYRQRELQQEQQRTGDPMVGFKGLFMKLINQMPSVKLPNYAFRQKSDFAFENAAAAWGLADPAFSNGAVCADLDNDGDLDLVVNNLGEPAFVYRNNAEKERAENNWLKLTFSGTLTNRFGLGCKVKAETDSGTIYQELTLTRGFQSSVEPAIYLGLGKARIQKLSVWWPSGKMQMLDNVQINRQLLLKESDANAEFSREAWLAAPKQPLFVLAENNASGISGVHLENTDGYVDFKTEPLIPQRFSVRGPQVVAGDVNGDGREDVLITGDMRGTNAASLFIQNANGSFTSKSGPWNTEFQGEASGALIFDADGDKDMDILLAAGSNEWPEGSANYRHGLYLNEGGAFRSASERLTGFAGPAGSVAAGDADGDGDMDIFLGGAVNPGRFPEATPSRLLRNNKGNFEDATAQFFSGGLPADILHSAVMADLNKDVKPELVTAGMWSPVTVYSNAGGRFDKNEMPGSKGWWNHIAVADIDGDGDADIIGGNKGLNSILRCSASEPLTVDGADLDGNGSYDAVCSYYLGGKSYPWHSYDELSLQMVGFVRRTFPRYADYADKSVPEIFGSNLQNALHRETQTLASCIFRNNSGSWSMEVLPGAAQMGPVMASAVADWNGDGKPDLLLAGNSPAPKVEFGNDDALRPLILSANGQRWNTLTGADAGLSLPVYTSGLAAVKTPGGTLLVAASVSGPVQVYRLNKLQTVASR